MSFGEALARGAFPVTLEITPPRQPNAAVLLRRARLLDGRALAVNVIQRPERQPSLDAALALRRAGVEPVWHLATGGRTRESIAADAERALAGGVGHALCLRGDHRATGGPSVREAIAILRERAPGLTVGAALDQYRQDAGARRALAGKLRAGAACLWTQPAFDLTPLLRAAETAKALRPDARVMAMAIPMLTPRALDAIGARLRIPAPEGLRRRIAAGEAEAWRAFDETLAVLAAADAIDGVAIMTWRADPPAGTGARIVEGLRRAGLAMA